MGEHMMPKADDEYLFFGQAYMHVENHKTMWLQLLNERWEKDYDRGSIKVSIGSLGDELPNDTSPASLLQLAFSPGPENGGVDSDSSLDSPSKGGKAFSSRLNFLQQASEIARRNSPLRTLERIRGGRNSPANYFESKWK